MSEPRTLTLREQDFRREPGVAFRAQDEGRDVWIVSADGKPRMHMAAEPLCAMPADEDEQRIRASERADVVRRVLEIINREAGKNWGHVGEAVCDVLRERIEREIGGGK